jgi:hypothetical protein
MIHNQQSQQQQMRSAAPPTRRAFGDITNSMQTGAFDDATGASLMKPSAMVISRPYMERPCDDIDSKDDSNPFLASTYVNPMYVVLQQQERDIAVSPDYMSKQLFINDKMRCILYDWMIEVHLKFKMVPETLYLTCHIIDRYLEAKQIRRSRLQLVGVAALLIAAKYEEIYPPDFKDLVYITDKAYNKQEILEMESEIVTTLNYNFTLPTIHSFLCRYLKAAHADRSMVQLACYLAERSLQEYTMLKFLPSVIAATAVMISRKSLRRHSWSPTLLKYTTYDECDLEACALEMERCVNDPNCQQQAVRRKYSTAKFGGVSSLPLSF